jgi:hypothetical protein
MTAEYEIIRVCFHLQQIGEDHDDAHAADRRKLENV